MPILRSKWRRASIASCRQTNNTGFRASRLLRLSKNLPHDWKEQRCFLGFAA
jgi:hypothetical protein